MELTTDLTYLAWSAALCAVLWMPYAFERIFNWGLVDAVGYPENPPEAAKWAQRAQRAHLNMVENLAVFAALVLVAHAAGAANAMTALGATLFFWGRVGHAVIFIIGIPWLRTLAFFIAWIGLLLIFLQIIT